jgi:hypothetical protein
MDKVYAIERELYGEIMKIKRERLVQVTRCMMPDGQVGLLLVPEQFRCEAV